MFTVVPSWEETKERQFVKYVVKKKTQQLGLVLCSASPLVTFIAL